MHNGSGYNSNRSSGKSCPICFKEQKELNFYKLCCEHEFCKDCLRQDFTLKINAGKTNLICPLVACNISANYYDLKNILETKIFEKYDKLLLNMMESNNSNEKKIQCPNCKAEGFIQKEAQYFDCSVCKEKFCSEKDCLGNWKDHQGLKCEIYKKKFKANANNNEIEFLSYVKEKKISKCPICQTYIEKIKNCNYITCESNSCQKKTIFCYICGKILKGEEKNTHYVDSNFYNKCKETRENNMNDIIFKKNKEKLTCSVCGNNDDATLKLSVDKNYQIVQCFSELCKNKYFCLYCKESWENTANDKLIKKHLNGQCIEKNRIKKLGKNIKCPGCNNSDESFFEIPENLKNNILICKKENSQVYCLICKSKIVNQDEILNHVNANCQKFENKSKANNTLPGNQHFFKDKLDNGFFNMILKKI